MTGERGGPTWWAVLGAGVVGALLASSLALALAGGRAADGAAAAQPTRAAAPESSPLPAESPVVTFVGDSWTVGEGATKLRGYAVLTGERLGWRYHVLGVSGSGYVQVGRGATYGDRIDRAVATDADVIVVQGSLNEQNSRVSDVATAARSTLAELAAAAAPGTRILVVGAPYTPGSPPSVIDPINEAIAAGARSAGLTFVDPAVENWTDPADPSLWLDPNHPNDAGHQLIADRLVPLLRETAGG